MTMKLIRHDPHAAAPGDTPSAIAAAAEALAAALARLDELAPRYRKINLQVDEAGGWKFYNEVWNPAFAAVESADRALDALLCEAGAAGIVHNGHVFLTLNGAVYDDCPGDIPVSACVVVKAGEVLGL